MLYSNYILPCLIDRAMNTAELGPLRKTLLSSATGIVAEIGFGSGANLPHYPDDITKLVAIDNSKPLLKRAKKRLASFRPPFEALYCPAERIKLEKHSVDTVVCTFTLCSVSGTLGVLEEVRRILRPGGKFLFLEHGLAPDHNVQKWQRRLTPFQKRLGGGCHLDRNVLGLLADACWDVVECNRFYVKGIPKISGYITMGQAL